MKMKAFFLLLSLLTTSCFASAQSEFCNTRNIAFAEGEQLYFKVWYNMGRIWVGAGEANFTVGTEHLNGKKMYHITGDGKTMKNYEWFYKVRDRYESWVDPNTMQP